MLVYAGIDEAGYGPMLGPLTVACACFVLPQRSPHESPPSLWKTLRHAVCRELVGAKGRIAVNDSKRLKLPNDGPRHPLIHLERGVLSFAQCLDPSASLRASAPLRKDPRAEAQRRGGAQSCETDVELCRRLVPSLSESISNCDWYRGDPAPLPVAVDPAALRIDANVLRHAMQRTGVSLGLLACEGLDERRFNEHVAVTRSKAATSFTLVGRHVARLFNEYGERDPQIVIDRQGGRMHYLRPLQTLFPEASIRIVAEEASLSRYELCDGPRRMTIIFTEEAEEKHLPVALASMLAKYLREIMMRRFNRYFTTLMPELKPTAGYYGDGRRFLSEIEDVIARLGVDRKRLVRCC